MSVVYKKYTYLFEWWKLGERASKCLFIYQLAAMARAKGAEPKGWMYSSVGCTEQGCNTRRGEGAVLKGPNGLLKPSTGEWPGQQVAKEMHGLDCVRILNMAMEGAGGSGSVAFVPVFYHSIWFVKLSKRVSTLSHLFTPQLLKGCSCAETRDRNKFPCEWQGTKCLVSCRLPTYAALAGTSV